MSVPLCGHRLAMAVLALAVAACFSPIHLSASAVVVGSCNPNYPAYTSINQAIQAVPAGSTIRICPNTYKEQIVISKSLTLIGVSSSGQAGANASGADNPIIASPDGGVQSNSGDLYNNFPTAAQILIQTPTSSIATPIQVNISNLIVDGSNNGLSGCGTDLVGIYYQNASGVLNHVVARFQELDASDFGCEDGLAIYVQSGYSSGGTANVTVQASSVHDYDKNGITADGSGTVATITGNFVVGIGATSQIAQNGIQMSYGATGSVTSNTVSNDIYVNPPNCSTPNNPSCYSATGILLYDSGGTAGVPLPVNGNNVSDAQGGIVAIADGSETADYNVITSNRVTNSPTAGIYYLDGIDLCSDNNTAKSNTVFNVSGAGVHVDGECSEPGGSTTGTGNSVMNNVINDACAGVLSGPGTGSGTGNTVSGNLAYNVGVVQSSGDSCPAPASTGSATIHRNVKLKTQPKR